MRKLLTSIVLMFTLASTATTAMGQSTGSQISGSGVLSVMLSPILSLEGKPLEASVALGAGGAFIVTGLAYSAGEIVTLSLKSAANGSAYTIKASASAVQGASTAVGTSIRVVAESTGYAIMAAGKLISFIPNEIGKALLHQSQVN